MPFLSPSLRVLSRRLAAALLWLVLLGGVFAMHGLATHGIGVATAASAPVAAMDHAAGAMHDVMPPVDPMPDEHHTGLAMMCLAILVAAISVAWMGRMRRMRPMLMAAPQHGGFLPRPRMTHPPPVARFSVMRC